MKLSCRSVSPARAMALLLILLSVLLSTVPAAAGAAGPRAAAITTEIDLNGHDILKFGNIELEITPDEFLRTFTVGDIVTVEIEGYDTLLLPVCGSYTDASAGERLLVASNEQLRVQLAVSYGSLASEIGLVENDPTGLFTYRLKSGTPERIPVRITIARPGGYLPHLTLGTLAFANDPEAYPDLTSEEYANFREITAGGILPGRLYRSASPISPFFNRNVQADEAARRAGIKTFINLTDSEAVAAGFLSLSESYCATQRIVCLSLPVSVGSEQFRTGFCKIFDAIISGEAPFLIHCDLGKDRCGLAAAVLEALCGASIADIRADYLKSFTNLYTIENGVHTALSDEKQQTIRKQILDYMATFMDAEITEESDVTAITEQFLLSLGVSQEKIAAVRAKLTE